MTVNWTGRSLNRRLYVGYSFYVPGAIIPPREMLHLVPQELNRVLTLRHHRNSGDYTRG